ncbi:CD1375 family protein [Paenibacillus sp. y28]|uniref:CD1375 family protein n=1 Tax=Paenibacillus sp. y28 TaxID=3129110 RepID=UPI00301A2A2D
MSPMVKLYYSLVKAGLREVDQVPANNGLRAAVQALIEEEPQNNSGGSQHG